MFTCVALAYRDTFNRHPVLVGLLYSGSAVYPVLSGGWVETKIEGLRSQRFPVPVSPSLLVLVPVAPCTDVRVVLYA